MKNILIPVMIFSFFLTGCSTAPIVQPTFEEYEAAKSLKKTVVITDISEIGSSVKGINEFIISELQSVMINNFNVVERTRLEPLMNERNFQSQADVQQQVEFGKILGADFVIYGTSVASFSGPHTKTDEHIDDDGDFTGKIWEEVEASAQVNIKVVDVRNGIIHSSITGTANNSDELNSSRFTDREEFNRMASLALMGARTEEYSESHTVEAERKVLFGLDKTDIDINNSVSMKSKDLSDLDRPYEIVISRAINKAAMDVGEKFVKKYGHLDGEILKIMSENEVLINMGSAYGVRPGMRLDVWDQASEIIDPRTGMVISPRVRKGILKVTQVTSGLSCIAKGSGGLVSNIKIGDYVTLQP